MDGKLWGEFTSTELLRLKGFLENSQLKKVYETLPVRSETTIWNPSTAEMYANSEGKVFETNLEEGFAKTTLKESYILPDPHPDAKRAPIVGEKSQQVNVGKYTTQEFSGAASMRERAEIIARMDILYKSVVEALQKANDVEAVESGLGGRLFDFIHEGK